MSRSSRPTAVLIAGPTASGKSALAVRLAERLDGLVVNADSMQVYRDLRILTARPDDAALRKVPHALYGTVHGAETFSVSRWLADVAGAIETAKAADRLPILVGGTGLYLKALTQGLSAIPTVPEEVRARLRQWATGMAPAELHAALASRDPTTASRLRPSDPQRLLRAIEVHEATGRGLASFHEERELPLLDIDACTAIALVPERRMLQERTDARFADMARNGGLEEVAALASRRLPSDLPVMRALGVPPLLRVLSGEVDIATAIDTAQRDTRRYIKRQETFLRNQLTRFRPVEPDRAEETLLSMCDRGIDQSA